MDNWLQLRFKLIWCKDLEEQTSKCTRKYTIRKLVKERCENLGGNDLADWAVIGGAYSGLLKTSPDALESGQFKPDPSRHMGALYGYDDDAMLVTDQVFDFLDALIGDQLVKTCAIDGCKDVRQAIVGKRWVVIICHYNRDIMQAMVKKELQNSSNWQRSRGGIQEPAFKRD